MRFILNSTRLFILSFVLFSCDKTPAPPAVTGMAPMEGNYLTEVTVTGSGFTSTAGSNIITVNNVDCEIVSATSTSVTFRIPSLTEGEWPVKIITKTGEADAGMFSYQYTVYAAGCENNSSGRSIGKYWKNGIGVSLTDGSARAWAYSMAVKGSDIHVVGNDGHGACYWKNGIPVSMDCSPSVTTFSSVFLIGNDIFITGSERQGDIDRACYWKNNTRVWLTDGTKIAITNGIFVI